MLKGHNLCWVYKRTLPCAARGPSQSTQGATYTSIIFLAGNNKQTIVCQLQVRLGQVERWVDLTGYWFLEEKMIGAHFRW